MGKLIFIYEMIKLMSKIPSVNTFDSKNMRKREISQSYLNFSWSSDWRCCAQMIFHIHSLISTHSDVLTLSAVGEQH